MSLPLIIALLVLGLVNIIGGVQQLNLYRTLGKSLVSIGILVSIIGVFLLVNYFNFNTWF